jgi:hypothetical protein
VADSSNHVRVEIELGVKENITPYFSIVPNPATNQIIVSLATPFHAVEIYDVYGRKLFTNHYSLITTNWVLVDVSNLHSGIYFVRVVFESGSSVRKVVKN